MKLLREFFTPILLSLPLCGVEFSDPAEFDEVGSNLGEQQIVEVVKRWVGTTPQELAPGVVALGSLKDRKYLLEDPDEVGGELVEVKEGTFQKTNKPTAEMSQVRTRPIEGWVGPLPEELAPGAIALGSLANRRFVTAVGPEDAELSASKSEEDTWLNLSAFTSARTYYTNNVMRQKSDEKKSMVLENALGLSLSTQGVRLGDYITMIPRVDMMMQVATYENKEVKDSLGYGFGMVKGGLNFELPNHYSISTGIEYNLLHSMDSGDKMFDAFAPSVRLSKIFAPGERTLLILDTSMKFALTQRVLAFEAPGVFADDGDNLQLGLSLALVQLLDEEGRFMLMPRIGLTRTEYLKNEQDGRVDWMVNAGMGLTWQAFDWLSLDAGVGWSTLWMNSKGEVLQGESSSFQAWDLGLTIMGSHMF